MPDAKIVSWSGGMGMCGRFTLREKLNRLLQLFHITSELNWQPRYNIVPTQSVVAIRQKSTELEADLMAWGLIPSWSADGNHPIVNARGDTITQKPSFKESFRSRRCLIAADGFYEWWKDQRTKHPFFIHLKTDEPFVLGGIWDTWREKETCTLITTSPNSLMETFHERMPVILPVEAANVWLNPASDQSTLLSFLAPFPAEAMEAYTVSTLVNSTRNDTPDCLQPENPKIQRGLW